MTQHHETSGREVYRKDRKTLRKQKAVCIVKQQVASTTNKDIIFKITVLYREIASVMRFFLFSTSVSYYLLELNFKTPSGCLNPWTAPSPTYTIFSIHIYLWTSIIYKAGIVRESQ